MFGIDPAALQNLANLQQQIQAFIVSTTNSLARIEQRIEQLSAQVSELQKERENG